MRKMKIIPGEYYHVYNRGNNKQTIFNDNRDWIRFLFLILYFQSSEHFNNLSRQISYYVKNRVFNIKTISKNHYADLICFTFMPNHFHLLVRELKEKGISKYMERVQKAYTKYFNTKYKKSGHLFQGPFQIIHIKDNRQLLHLSAYIHSNCKEMKQWRFKKHQYPWSSYQDYLEKNRWREFLKPSIILDQFSTPKEYKNFVDTSGAKLELDERLLLDF